MQRVSTTHDLQGNGNYGMISGNAHSKFLEWEINFESNRNPHNFFFLVLFGIYISFGNYTCGLTTECIPTVISFQFNWLEIKLSMTQLEKVSIKC